MRKNYIVITESLTDGHPDKLCDRISDAVVDNYLIQDPTSRIRAQCAVSRSILFIAARYQSQAVVDLSETARKVIREIGYESKEFNAATCSILTSSLAYQPDVRYDFDEREMTDSEIEALAVKEQTTVFGFAADETPPLMPMPIYLAHRVARELVAARQEKRLPYLFPDGKVQVGVEYRDRRPYRIHNVAVITDHQEGVEADPEQFREDIRKAVIDPVFETERVTPDKETQIFVNPNGRYIGGPDHHSGLTGRKTALDSYGEYHRHSGKGLSGKDPLRIDRIGAYAARYAAKNVVASGLAAKCEVLVSYSMGLSRPASLEVETFGTGKRSDAEITELVKTHFDFRLAGILRDFDLRRLPQKHQGRFYQKLAAYGHFGRTDLELPWERVDKTGVLAG
jgi:S-adenosylmethionine synthetase